MLAKMKVLRFVFCFCIFWVEALCLGPEYVAKSEVKMIVSTLNAFMEETTEQLKILNQRTEELMMNFVLEIDEPSLMLNDTTIEERVTILEFQVESLTTEVTDLTVEVTDQGDEIDVIDGEVAALFTDQVIQNERILELETQSDGFEDSISILDSTVSDIDSRLTAVNYTLDSRVSQMEVTGTVAFQADLDAYTSIPIDSVVIFDQVSLNIGNGYDSSTGQFTVPTAGAGLYYLYVNFFGNDHKYLHFDVRVNGGALCRAGGDLDVSGEADNAIATCGAITALSEGDVVDVFYTGGTDDTPVPSNTVNYNTFTGFRIAPE